MDPGNDVRAGAGPTTTPSGDRRDFLRKVTAVGALSAVTWSAPTVTRAGRVFAAQGSPAPLPTEPTPCACSAAAYGLQIVAAGAVAVNATFPSGGGCVGSHRQPLGTYGELTATTICGDAAGCLGTASIAELNVLFSGTVISASVLTASADTDLDCGTVGSSVASLTIGGVDVAIGTSPNEKVSVPGLGEVVVNEQTTGCSEGFVTVAVSALRISLSVAGQTLDVVAAHAGGRTCCAC